uniref:Uncharacterized protein n=1 Tax=Strigamia maritima TaxID=126957 RepID=T1J594_STRMM
MLLQKEKQTWLFLVLQLSVIGSVTSHHLIPQLFNDVDHALHHVFGPLKQSVPSSTTSQSQTYEDDTSSYSETSSSGTFSSGSSFSGSSFGGSSSSGSSSGGSSSSGSSSSGSSSSGSYSGGSSSSVTSSSNGIEYYNVESNFIQLIQYVRASTTEVKINAQQQSNGLYKITITTDKGSKTYDNFSKASFDLLARLLRNPTLQVKEVGKAGNKVKISVSPEPPKPTNIFQIRTGALNVVEKLRKGGYSINIVSSGDKFTITVTDTSNGKKKAYSDVPANTGNAFIRLVKDPSLQYQILGTSGDETFIFVPDYIRGHPENSFKLNLEPMNPDLQYKVTPAANGESTITLQGHPQDLTADDNNNFQGTEYYTVNQKFVQLVNEVRESTKAVKLKYQPQADGLLSVTLTTDKGSKTYDKVPRDVFQLFVKLLKNPTLQIKEVGKVGKNKVKIAVSPQPPKPTNIIRVKHQFLDVVQKLRKGGYSIQITKGDKYTITVTDDKNGKKKTYHDVPAKIGDAFIRLVKDPSLQYQILGKTKDETVLFIPDYSGKQKTLTVRKHPNNRIDIKTGTDGKYELTIDDDKKHPTTYKHIDPNLLFAFITLIKNPDLQFKVSPATHGEFTITLEEQPQDLNTETIDSDQFIEFITKAKSDPSYNLKIDTGENGLELVITHNGKIKKYPLPAKFLNIIIKLIQSEKRPKTVKHDDGQTTFILDDEETPTPVEVDMEFTDLVEEIKKNPTADVKFKWKPNDNGKYTLTVFINGKPKELKNQTADTIKFLIKLSKDPTLPIHIKTEKPVNPVKPGKKTEKPVKPEEKKPEHEKPGHKKPEHEKPIINIVTPGKTEDTPITTIPKEQLELVQTIKTAPQISVSVAPDGPNFKITVTDGQDTK